MHLPGRRSARRRARVLAVAFALAARATLAAEPSPPVASAAVAVAPVAAAPPAAIPPELLAPPRADLHADARRRSFAWPAAEVLAVQAVMMAWNDQVGEATWAKVTPATIASNARGGGRWEFDSDPYWVNEFAHPYQGTLSFTAARSAGLGFWESFPYTFFASLLWEYAGETTRPAINDQVTTPIAGAVLGEILFRGSGMLLRDPGLLRAVGAGVLAPVGAFNRAVLGDWTERPTNPAELSAWTGALGLQQASGPDPTFRGARPELGLKLVYGPAGDPETRLDKPFDHFDLVASYAAKGDAVASVLARGVLWGRQFEGAARRGLWGVYLGYDFLSPGSYRVSTSYLGLGASTRFFLAPWAALDVDAVGAGVGVGAAGRVYSGPAGQGRDYLFGSGVQGALDARLRVGTLAELGLGAREYLLFADADSVGRERIGYYGASALVRVFGPHGLGFEGVLALRRATGLPEPAAAEDGRMFRVYYAYAPAAPISPVPRDTASP